MKYVLSRSLALTSQHAPHSASLHLLNPHFLTTIYLSLPNFTLPHFTAFFKISTKHSLHLIYHFPNSFATITLL
jgi:hypothetical protein